MQGIRRLDIRTDETRGNASCSGCASRDLKGRPTHPTFTSGLIILGTNTSPSTDDNRIAAASRARRSLVKSGNGTVFCRGTPYTNSGTASGGIASKYFRTLQISFRRSSQDFVCCFLPLGGSYTRCRAVTDLCHLPKRVRAVFPRVEVRHLHAVIGLAEELNFTRAADRLHITQLALSKQINEIEKQHRFHRFARKKQK